ncbi:pilus (MSHA type) biogenesis protein MshL [Paraburkholderia heleia]|uniref:pilus (MSHA type) biogenesis protein MshL n=1 Tax=Paraburkholderia heleia TaxID=634127 RepID=UPI002AB6C7FE|nr:pilus (MSHA type) biogenesis protein MshL [Paraburkholderia heleia]
MKDAVKDGKEAVRNAVKDTLGVSHAVRFAQLSLAALVVSACSLLPNSTSKLPSDKTESDLRGKETEVATKVSRDMAAERDSLQAGIAKSVPPPTPALRLAPPSLDELADRVVDVNVVNAPLPDILQLLADQLKVNLIMDPALTSMTEKATFVEHRVSARATLANILHTYDIDGEVRGHSIYASLMQTREFNVGMLGSKASLSVNDGGDVFGGFAKQGSTQVRGDTSLKAETGSTEDGYDELSKVLDGLFLQGRTGSAAGGEISKTRGSYTLDRASGTLFVSARPSVMKTVERIVESDKAMRRRQVQIEAQIIDVQLSDGYQLGVDWTLLTKTLAGRLGTGAITIPSATTPLSGGLSGRSIVLPQTTVGSASGGGGLAYNGSTFAAALNALRTFGTVRMLSDPVVRVRNGVPAYLSVGQNIRYISKVDSTFNNVGGSSSVTSSDVETDSLFSGVVVGVSASVGEDGRIELFVRPMETQVEQPSLALINVGNGNEVTLPVIDMKGMYTNLAMNDGDVAIIGGLIDEQSTTSNQGLPGLADIPGVGRLFDNDSTSRANRELVLVIRARVI